ncbi:MAG: LysR family transcriptional regulator [Selenomonadaceae bacterium]|nr:LysR family transcriptional regulator [Selenomonadaceae bacterium]
MRSTGIFFISQTAVTQQIRKLEEIVNVQLFTRTKQYVLGGRFKFGMPNCHESLSRLAWQERCAARRDAVHAERLFSSGLRAKSRHADERHANNFDEGLYRHGNNNRVGVLGELGKTNFKSRVRAAGGR